MRTVKGYALMLGEIQAAMNCIFALFTGDGKTFLIGAALGVVCWKIRQCEPTIPTLAEIFNSRTPPSPPTKRDIDQSGKWK